MFRPLGLGVAVLPHDIIDGNILVLANSGTENAVFEDVELPEVMKRAMARQAEAERDRRAKVINAEGEFQAASKLAEASVIIERHPTALQLRYLQTMNEMSAENNTTTIFPIPIDLFRPFFKQLQDGSQAHTEEGPGDRDDSLKKA